MSEPEADCRVEWEYRKSPLKVSSFTDRLVTDDMDEAGREGWELIKILPLPKPDPKGFFDTLVGTLVYRRPSNTQHEFRYEPLKLDEEFNRHTFGSADKLGREGWELVRIEAPPRPDRKGSFLTTHGVMVFRRPRPRSPNSPVAPASRPKS